MESDQIWASGLVIREVPGFHSNYRATQSLCDWLREHHVVGIAGIDTRALTHRLREQGAWGKNKEPLLYQVVVHDFGVKQTNLKILRDLGCALTIVPADFPFADVLAMQPDGIFLSNGPGDPSACDYAIRATQAYLAADKPILGICL